MLSCFLQCISLIMFLPQQLLLLLLLYNYRYLYVYNNTTLRLEYFCDTVYSCTLFNVFHTFCPINGDVYWFSAEKDVLPTTDHVCHEICCHRPQKLSRNILVTS